MVTIQQEQTVRQFGIVSIVRKTQNIEYHVIFSIKYYEPQNIKPIVANDQENLAIFSLTFDLECPH